MHARRLPVVVDGQRRVIGKTFRLVDANLSRGGGDARRGDLVIDAPADVFRPGLAAVRPPGVLLGPLIDAAEHIDPADCVEYFRQPVALLRQKTGVLAVALPVLEIDFLVRDVPVAADDELARFAAQRRHVRQKGVEKTEFRLLAIKMAGT